MTAFEDIGFAQRQRLHFIESLALWEGAVQRQRICDSFDVVLTQVTRDIGMYVDRCPDNLTYNNRQKVYLPTSKFKPVLASGDANEHLSLLRAGVRKKTVDVLPSLTAGTVVHAVLPTPTAHVQAEVLRVVLHAIRFKLGVRLHYLSMQGGESVRSIWPHGLMFATNWWYARAYDEVRRQFRDFALHRMDAAELIDQPGTPGAEADDLWQQTAEVVVIPDPRLSEVQQRIVARDFQMENEQAGWAWKERMRLCQIGYFAAAHWLDVSMNRPRRTRVTLKNKTELEQYFFKQPAGLEG
jgi:predicted DNA-binding transcriptional regulator YafY